MVEAGKPPACECVRPGCSFVVRPNRIACIRHWLMLPSSLRSGLIDEWHEGAKYSIALILQCYKEWDEREVYA